MLRKQKANQTGNILLLTDSTSETTESCHSLLTQSPSGPRDVLGIAIDKSPNSLLRHWQLTNNHQHVGNYGFVDIDDACRSTTTVTETNSGFQSQYSIRLVESPSDLAAIGSELTAIIDAWDDNHNQLVVCMYTLTTLIQHTELPILYQFITILPRQLSAENATAHYHVDPTQIDSEALNIIKHLFDNVIDRTASSTQ